MATSVPKVYPLDEMEIGIIDLTSSGKPTLFNSLTGHHVEVGTYGSSRVEVHVGISKLLDERMEDKNYAVQDGDEITFLFNV